MPLARPGMNTGCRAPPGSFPVPSSTLVNVARIDTLMPATHGERDLTLADGTIEGEVRGDHRRAVLVPAAERRGIEHHAPEIDHRRAAPDRGLRLLNRGSPKANNPVYGFSRWKRGAVFGNHALSFSSLAMTMAATVPSETAVVI